VLGHLCACNRVGKRFELNRSAFPRPTVIVILTARGDLHPPDQVFIRAVADDGDGFDGVPEISATMRQLTAAPSATGLQSIVAFTGAAVLASGSLSVPDSVQ
jgi:hypothetical protein